MKSCCPFVGDREKANAFRLHLPCFYFPLPFACRATFPFDQPRSRWGKTISRFLPVWPNCSSPFKEHTVSVLGGIHSK